MPREKTASDQPDSSKAAQGKSPAAHRKAKPKTIESIFQFKITLLDINPAIWRRVHVADCTFDKLHEHIQTAMGWTNSAPFHCSRRVRDYVRQWNHRLELHYLPKYAPETNPIERVWWRMHETLTRNHRCPNMGQLINSVYEWFGSRNSFYDRDLANYLTAA